MSDQIISYIRTNVPIAVGTLLSYLTVNYGFVVSDDIKTPLVALLTGALISLYYLIARELEKRFPEIGKYLLGSSKQPEYKETN